MTNLIKFLPYPILIFMYYHLQNLHKKLNSNQLNLVNQYFYDITLFDIQYYCYLLLSTFKSQMGNTSSNYQDLVKNYTPSQWIKIQDQGNYQVWEYVVTHQKYDVYLMPTELYKDLQELQKYEFRKIHYSKLVAPSFVLKPNNSYLCSGPYNSLVAMEHIKYRLSQIPRKLNLQQSLSVLYHSTDGFNILTSFFGQLQPNDDLICFNEEGVCKVWINENLSNNFPSINNEIVEINSKNKRKQYINNHLFNQTQNIQILIKVIEKNTIQPYSQQLKQSFLAAQNSSDIISSLQKYCEDNRIEILNRVNFDDVPQKKIEKQKVQQNRLKHLPINFKQTNNNKIQAQAPHNYSSVQNPQSTNINKKFQVYTKVIPPQTKILNFSEVKSFSSIRNTISPNVISANYKNYYNCPLPPNPANYNSQVHSKMVLSDHSKVNLHYKGQSQHQKSKYNQSQNGENKIIIKYTPKINKQVVKTPVYYHNYAKTNQNSPISNKNPLTPSHSEKQFTMNSNKLININQNEMIKIQDSRSSYNHPIHQLMNQPNVDFNFNNKNSNSNKNQPAKVFVQVKIQRNPKNESNRNEKSEIENLTSHQNQNKNLNQNQIQRRQNRSQTFINKLTDLQQMNLDREIQTNQIKRKLRLNQKQSIEYVQTFFDKQKVLNLAKRTQSKQYPNQAQVQMAEEEEQQHQNSHGYNENQDFRKFRSEDLEFSRHNFSITSSKQSNNNRNNNLNVQNHMQYIQSEHIVESQVQQTSKFIQNSQQLQNQELVKLQLEDIQKEDKTVIISSIETQSKICEKSMNLNKSPDIVQTIQKIQIKQRDYSKPNNNNSDSQNRYLQSQRLNSMDYDDIEAYIKNKYRDYLTNDKNKNTNANTKPQQNPYKYPTSYVPIQKKPVQPYKSAFLFLQKEEIFVPRLQIKKIISTTHNYSKIDNNNDDKYKSINGGNISDKFILDTYQIDRSPLKFEEEKILPKRQHKRNTSRASSYLLKTQQFDKIDEKYTKYVKKSVRESEKTIQPIYSSREDKNRAQKTNRIYENEENIESLSRISSKPVIQKQSKKIQKEVESTKQKKISYSTLRQLLWN